MDLTSNFHCAAVYHPNSVRLCVRACVCVYTVEECVGISHTGPLYQMSYSFCTFEDFTREVS